ncbi:MAG: hypothetical protein M3447_11295, partial [Acidobacteriota bacterium]|nr:hypothetical protein [Acidobacteriota bacterium]
FLFSRGHQVTDSSYSMMLTQSLLDHRSFTLDHYKTPAVYQLETINGHTYYRFPPGSPVLSLPFVWVLNRFGISAVNPEGTYNPRGEVMIEAGLAAFLMALLAAIFFYQSRIELQPGWSALIALGGALGTQVYSTASRALWSETWGILLLGVVILLLLAHESGKRRLSPILLATLLSWMYFVRPTFAVPIAAISIYVFLLHRPLFLRYALTGAAWLAGFVLYSRYHFGELLPDYYRANRLLFNIFGTALAGNLISPARGLLVYVPVLLFVGYLLVRYRKFLGHTRLMWLAVAIIFLHLLVISGFPHWWGGHSFGPRFTTGLVPWFVLLAILGVQAMLNWRAQNARSQESHSRRLEMICGGGLLLLSVVINTLGATSHATWLWNIRPRGVDEHPERLWDWRQPQFLAGYLPYPPPQTFPNAETGRIDFTTTDADKYFWYGWNDGAPDARWTETKAALVFGVASPRPGSVRLFMAPYLVPGKLESQRFRLLLNDRELLTTTLTAPAGQSFDVQLPAEVLREKNTMIFELPDAAAPQKLGSGPDPRPRGIRLVWVEFGP